MGEIRGSSHQILSRLPAGLTPFVGREPELEAARRLLEDPSIRLVTILGIGGIGKTTLALQLARGAADRFEDGVVFLPLSQLDSIEDLLPALAQVLDIQLPPSGDLEQVVLESLATQQRLLVLDGFEHLLPEATLLRDILVAAPRVKILVTSREKLNLECETPYHLRGLALPPAVDSRDVREFDSIRLFLQRAHQARPGFTLDARATAAVVRLCHMVDGTPLGIVLAAAWVEHFSPEEIADEAGRSLDFLARALRDADPRHSGLRAVFDSSFKRLDPDQKDVFLKLSVFRGGFDLAAAQTVASANINSLIALAEKSMLGRDPETGRYEIHGVLGQYAREALAASGERDRVLDAHTGYYRDFVQAQEARILSGSQMAALNDIRNDLDNIRQAWSRIVDQRDFQSARRMLPGLYAYCDMRSLFYEGEAMFRHGADRLAPQAGEAPDGVWALVLLSWFDMHSYFEHLDSYDLITSQAQACLEHMRAAGDGLGIAASLVLLGAIAIHRDRFKSAIPLYTEAIQIHSRITDFFWVDMRVGLAYQSAGCYEEALAAFDECLQRGRKAGERVKTGWSLQNIGDTLYYQGKYAEAEAPLQQAMTLFREVGTRDGVLWSTYFQGKLAVARGNLERGRELALAADGLAHEIHSASWIRTTEELLRELDPVRAAPPVQNADEALSQRELEVMQLLKSDLSGPEIADRLVVSLNTVRFHTKHIYQKLGVNSRLEAISRAKELGL